MSNSKYTYGDLPDDMITKPYIPLSRHTWRLFKILGFEELYGEIIPNLSTDVIYDVMKERLDESIYTAKDKAHSGGEKGSLQRIG